jgi:putative transposase
MHYEPEKFYHIYNQGTNNKILFRHPHNYEFFLKKVKTAWLPHLRILGYCLVPRQFHFVIQVFPEACYTMELGGLPSHLQMISHAIGQTLSGYAKAFNRAQGTRGVLFEKKTDGKLLCDDPFSLETYIRLIERKPVHFGLVKSPEDWPYSSLHDPAGLLLLPSLHT